MTTSLPDHDTMVRNILRYREAATHEQALAGMSWYPTAAKLVRLIAEQTGVEPLRVAYCLSALSPRNPWRWNVADAYAFASAKAEGRAMPSATTFRRNWKAAWQALDADGAPWLTAAPKVNAFVSCIMSLGGHAVVVDTWAVRVATAGAKTTVSSRREYDLVANAYAAAAKLSGCLPASMQAITWLVAQAEGLGSNRRGRHDLSYKAGTPDLIVNALSEGEL